MKRATIIWDDGGFYPGWSCLADRMENISGEHYGGPVHSDNVELCIMSDDPNHYRLALATF